MGNVLLEIGTEEIPARFLPATLVKLRENAGKFFSEARITIRSVRTYATPRRLSMIAEVDDVQEPVEKEIWGPPVSAAFDKEGRPAKAAEAFVKTHGITFEDLLTKEKGKGTYIVAIIKESALPTQQLLPELLSRLVLSLNFPKSMRWGSGSLRFVRPIHWILALYNNEKVPFVVDSLKSGAVTRGHRFLSPASFELKDSGAYINLLKNNYVVLDQDERKKIIIEESKKLAASVNATLVGDDELLEHVMFLVEYPVPVLGNFSPDYLQLPKELLQTVMKGHQKYFSLEDARGSLTNYFIVVSNTIKENAGTIKKGAEKVIKARFEDARFYYEEDKKTPLKELLGGLKKVVYHDRLGSVYDKSMRIVSIADLIADRCCSGRFERPDQFEQFRQNVHTAAPLSKTDLISGVVREFPELQGIMAGYYARHEGYNEDVSSALAEHYLPAHSGDRLPETDSGAVLSLADKLDNLASFFMLGLTPTGAEDPFALRRQALGVISILIDRQYDISVPGLLESALQALDAREKEGILKDLVKFFEQRLEPLLLSQGYPLDAVASVLAFTGDRPLHTIKARLDSLKKIREDAGFDPFLLAIKRINNIAPKTAVPPVKEAIFSQEEERTLYQELNAVKPDIRAHIKGNRYYEALERLMTLTGPINAFFDKVLVMDKDEEVKQNRLSLINEVRLIAREIADFSKLS